jgi:hypothetical protein
VEGGGNRNIGSTLIFLDRRFIFYFSSVISTVEQRLKICIQTKTITMSFEWFRHRGKTASRLTQKHPFHSPGFGFLLHCKNYSSVISRSLGL